MYPYNNGYSDLITTFSGQALLTSDVTGTLATNGTATNVTITSPGQTARISFTGTAGKDWVVNTSAMVMSGSSPRLNYTVKKPDGSTLTSGNCYPAGNGCSAQGYNLPASGTYTIEYVPYPAGSTGTFTVKSWESSRVTGSLTVGTTGTLTSTVPGQVVQHTFSGTSGQQLGLALSNFTTSIAGATLYVYVLKPDNSTLKSTTFTASSTATTPLVLDLPVLPTTGTYTVQVYPYNNGYSDVISTFSGQVLLSQDVAATLATNGTPTNITIASPGQTARLSFTGNAGKDWVMNLSALTLTGSGPYLNYTVKKPDGSYLTSGYCYPAGNGCSVQSYNLAASGTYTVEITPYPAGSTGTFTVKSWESSRVTGALTIGTSSTYTSTVPGQVVQYTFSGTAGQLLKMNLSAFTTSISGATLYVVIVKPDSTAFTSNTFTAAYTTPNPWSLDVPALPTTGTYTVQVYPYNNGYSDAITTFTGQVLLNPR